MQRGGAQLLSCEMRRSCSDTFAAALFAVPPLLDVGNDTLAPQLESPSLYAIKLLPTGVELGHGWNRSRFIGGADFSFLVRTTSKDPRHGLSSQRRRDQGPFASRHRKALRIVMENATADVDAARTPAF